MTRTVSIINLKGGVGKTTITVALAEFLAEEHGKKVLVVDLDPQTNATVALITQQDWETFDKNGRTLAQLFRDVLEGTNRFQIGDAIIEDVSNVHGGINGLDLLPSSLELIWLQDDLPLVPQKTRYRTKPFDVLRDASKGVIPTYDYILIDCPPNLGLITQNGLRLSDSFLIPTIPDILSTLGIPQILKRTKLCAADWNQVLTPLGIVLSKVRSIGLHTTETKRLQSRALSGEYPQIFKTIVKEAARSGEAMDSTIPFGSLKQKWGYGTYYDVYQNLTSEFVGVCN